MCVLQDLWFICSSRTTGTHTHTHGPTHLSFSPPGCIDFAGLRIAEWPVPGREISATALFFPDGALSGRPADEDVPLAHVSATTSLLIQAAALP